MDEISELIIRLTNNVSRTRYIVTADHGFIYKRNKTVEWGNSPQETLIPVVQIKTITRRVESLVLIQSGTHQLRVPLSFFMLY